MSHTRLNLNWQNNLRKHFHYHQTRGTLLFHTLSTSISCIQVSCLISSFEFSPAASRKHRFPWFLLVGSVAETRFNQSSAAAPRCQVQQSSSMLEEIKKGNQLRTTFSTFSTFFSAIQMQNGWQQQAIKHSIRSSLMKMLMRFAPDLVRFGARGGFG